MAIPVLSYRLVILRYGAGLSEDQIGTLLDLSAPSVRAILARTLDRLCSRLDQLGHGPIHSIDETWLQLAVRPTTSIPSGLEERILCRVFSAAHQDQCDPVAQAIHPQLRLANYRTPRCRVSGGISR